jgi:hypothetical protein
LLRRTRRRNIRHRRRRRHGHAQHHHRRCLHGTHRTLRNESQAPRSLRWIGFWNMLANPHSHQSSNLVDGQGPPGLAVPTCGCAPTSERAAESLARHSTFCALSR